VKNIADEDVTGCDAGADQSSRRGRRLQIHAQTKVLAKCLTQPRVGRDRGHFGGEKRVEDVVALSARNTSQVEVAG
jgi:hypothetical protein